MITIKHKTGQLFHEGENENKHHLTDVSGVIWISLRYVDNNEIQEFSMKERE